MYCNKCGNEIPEGSKFCGSCGAAIQRKQETAVKKPKKAKKRVPLWMSLIAIAAGALLGKFVLAPAMMPDPESSQNYYQQEETNVPNVSNATANETYTEIFNSRYIVEMGALFRGLDSAEFAIVRDGDMIEKLQYGYENDIIKEMINTLYYPVSDMDDAQKSGLDATVKENLAACTSADFCSVTYNMGNLYYTVELHFTDLDSSENLQKMYEFGLINESGANYISMQQTEANLIADGYVKK